MNLGLDVNKGAKPAQAIGIYIYLFNMLKQWNETMPTNDEIINIVNWVKAAEIIKDDKGLLTIRIILNSVLNEARADEREKAVFKAAEKTGQRAFTPATAKEAIELIKQPNTQLTMTTKTLQELLQDEDIKSRADTARQIFAELEAIKDEYGNPLLDTLDGKGRQYAKVKMKYTNKIALCKNCHKPIYYSDSTWYHLGDGYAKCETTITYGEPDEELIKKEGD